MLDVEGGVTDAMSDVEGGVTDAVTTGDRRSRGRSSLGRLVTNGALATMLLLCRATGASC